MTEEVKNILEEIKDYIEGEVFQIVSPDYWYAYACLHDMVEHLEELLNSN